MEGNQFLLALSTEQVIIQMTEICLAISNLKMFRTLSSEFFPPKTLVF
jgi:hypothetical protein